MKSQEDGLQCRVPTVPIMGVMGYLSSLMGQNTNAFIVLVVVK